MESFILHSRLHFPGAIRAINPAGLQRCRMLRHAPLVMATLLLASTFPAGAPLIEFDTKEFECGTVDEGATENLEAVFTAKNSGDSTLHLAIRPGCGCMALISDSIVEPGKSTRIKAAVKIGNFMSGSVSRTITITSNARNDSIVRLVVRAKILPSIAPSAILIKIRPGEKTVLRLTTPKDNLKVSGVTFTPSGDSSDSSGKRVKPLSVSYAFFPIDTVRIDGLWVYCLELESFALDSPTEGKFIISTNHPHKKELCIRGRVEK